jgi:hypothetical protein
VAKLSIIIPSRDEQFLIPTIDDIFRNARSDDTEVVAVLDSDKWPEGWKEVADRHPRLTTIHNGKPIGMRGSINKGVGSAKSRGAKFIMKLDGHCSLGEGFDEILKADCGKDWVVVPRRLRLEPESWTIAEPNKPPYDYHFLSFPDDPQDFGGPGLNGKPWFERQRERAYIELDEEMSSQGSCWFMHADYFTKLQLMDEGHYGPFWSEFQEIGLNCWLSGGRVMVNKKTHYAHLHKGKKYGRGYRLPESALVQGRNHTMKWIWNEAWSGQTLPFKWLISHFWPVPSWPENWEEVLYAKRKPSIRLVSQIDGSHIDWAAPYPMEKPRTTVNEDFELRIVSARYGILGSPPPFREHSVDVVERVRELVRDDSLDIIVNNSTLTPNQNPFRGKKKVLLLTYSYGGDEVTVERIEKDWLIIGQAQEREIANGVNSLAAQESSKYNLPTPVVTIRESDSGVREETARISSAPRTPAALNDYLIRKFSISPQRLRGPMPIELRDFHRNDLAQLFAELGFKRGAEIGVAEGKFSEILCKSNPDLHLLCVDPWHSYKGNPQSKTKEKDEFAYRETQRRLTPYPNVKLDMRLSMDAVRDVEDGSLDFISIDGHHGFRFVMMDLLCWTTKVRSGGIILLDDYIYLDRKRWGAGVVEAVQAFTSANEINPWFICDADRSVDAFFVRGEWK